MTRFPEPIARFAAQVTGPEVTVTDRSWPRENSCVWELATTSGSRFFLKRHPTALFHSREVTAYREWTTRLGPGRAPILLGADATLRTIIVTALPGYPASDPLVLASDQAEIHRQAGILLRRLHEAAPPIASTTGTDRIAARAEDHLQRAVGLLEPQQTGLIRDHAARLSVVARDLPAVPIHGDAHPKNFLWNPAASQLSLIDFERSEPAPAVRDLIRLEYGPWAAIPHLREAFFDGYGRPLTSTEEVALQSFAALDAISAIQWGTTNGEATTAARGYQTLTRLAAREE
jgi:Ser/Thr protein kinase RdoA (MazF antagonist)